MSEERSFLTRLFVRDPRWTARWPERASDAWDGGASLDDDEESLHKIAATATGADLRRVLRCGRDTVVQIALNNPAVTAQDIADLCSSSRCGTNVLGTIARRKEWSGDPHLAKILCLNPKTPYFASRFLLIHLQVSDLREVAQSGQVPPSLANDAEAQIEKKRTRKMGR